MAQVQGTVEAVSTKYGKFSVMVNGNWYGTKQEWAPSPLPNKGDNVSFDDGGGKFIKKCSIIGSGGSNSETKTYSGKKGFSTLGVELGHAANLSMQATLANDDINISHDPEEFWKEFDRNCDIAFQIMKSKRDRYESGAAQQAADAERVKKVEERLIKKSAPKPTISDEDIF